LIDCSIGLFTEASDEHGILCHLATVIELLPPASKAVFELLVSLFAKVHSYRDMNKMAAKNLAIVFAPTLMRYSVADLKLMLEMSENATTVIETCILHYNEIFLVCFSAFAFAFACYIDIDPRDVALLVGLYDNCCTVVWWLYDHHHY
jgi:hypothetical protein